MLATWVSRYSKTHMLIAVLGTGIREGLMNHLDSTTQQYSFVVPSRRPVNLETEALDWINDDQYSN